MSVPRAVLSRFGAEPGTASTNGGWTLMKLPLALFSLLFFARLLVAEPAIRADFVVATTGSDDNPGTAAKVALAKLVDQNGPLRG